MLYQFMMKNIQKTKIRTYGDKVQSNFCAINAPEVRAEL